MSKPDIHLLALCYELEIERNGGDWRLRNSPTQNGLNGKPPAQKEEAAPEKKEQTGESVEAKLEELSLENKPAAAAQEQAAEAPTQAEPEVSAAEPANEPAAGSTSVGDASRGKDEMVAGSVEDLDGQAQPEPAHESEDAEQQPSDDDDSDGWITPSNLKKHQAKDNQVSTPSEAIEQTLQAALLTSDFAMQNVALRINLL
jgi:RNA-binding protein NOB1